MKYPDIKKIYNLLNEIRLNIHLQNLEPLDLKQAAEYLKLKPSYLYSLIHQNKIPHYKPGGKKVYFNKLDLNKWISDSKIKSFLEIEQEHNKQNESKDK